VKLKNFCRNKSVLTSQPLGIGCVVKYENTDTFLKYMLSITQEHIKHWQKLKLTFLPLYMLHSSYKWKQKIVAADKKLQWVLQCLPLPRKITPDSSIYSTLLFHLIIDTIHTMKPTNARMLKLNF
jgi:hypothetical protein